MTCRIFICSFFVCFGFAAFAQIPYGTMLFGDTLSNNRGSASVIMNDGSVFFGGTVSNGEEGSDDITVFHINADGNILWQKFFGDVHDEYVNNMILYDNTTLVLCGDSRDAETGNLNGFLLKINIEGDELAYTTYESETLNEDFYGITKTANGDILVTGFISATFSAGNDILLVRYNSELEKLWDTSWGETDNDYAMGIVELGNGDIFLSGDRKISTTAYNACIAKCSADGDLIFDKTIDSPYNSGCKTVLINTYGNIMLVGESATDFSFVFDVLLMEIDTAGNILWTQLLGEAGAEAGYDIAENPSGNFYITGYGFNTTNNDILVMHTDRFGNELERKYFGGDAIDYSYDIKANADGEFWVSGFSSVEGNILFALVYDHFEPVVEISSSETKNEISVFPNPANDYIRINSGSDIVDKIEIFDINGNSFLQIEKPGLVFQLPNGMQRGVYFLKLHTGKEVFCKKILIC